MERKKKPRLALIGDLLLLTLLVPAVFILSFGTTLLQERDTFYILWTAARMKLSDSDIGSVGSSRQRWLITTGKDYAPLETYFRQRGWIASYQKGAVRVYSRTGKKIYVRCKMYSSRYMICQADRQP